MKLIKAILQGFYYFGVGLRASLNDLFHPHARGANRHYGRVSLAAILMAVTLCSWGLITGCSQRQPSAAPPNPSEAQSAAPETDEPSSEPSPSEAPGIEAIAGATRFEPVEAEQLSRLIKKRAEEYKEEHKDEVTNVPPAAGDIAAWKKTNSDVVGWITISNTNINYPVVVDPSYGYYTNRGYYKEPSRNGVLWLDADTRFDASGKITSQNGVIYGHNWTNCWRPVRIGNPQDVMFAQLAAYDNEEFAMANQTIRLATADGDHLYKVFSVFYTDLSFGYNYADNDASKNVSIPNIIKKAKSLSIHQFPTEVSDTDQVITLSTCTRVMGPGDNQRFVVMAKKIS